MIRERFFRKHKRIDAYGATTITALCNIAKPTTVTRQWKYVTCKRCLQHKPKGYV